MRQPTPRSHALAEVNEQHFDAVIIGGGINGAAVARDAALRGLKICLFEQSDFAGGASGRSSKIADAGLRSLRTLKFRPVHQTLSERLLLRKLLPHLVSPQSFCYPVYKGGPDPMWKVKLGLTVYDNLAGPGNKEKHVTLTPRETLAANPRLRAQGMAGAVRYWDDRIDDARICIETVLAAEDAGARCFNYTRVVEARRRPSSGLFEVDYADVINGATGSVRTRAIVNCAGPWADAVLTNVLRAPSRQLNPTKGVHIVVPRIEGQDALILDNPRDRRTFFAVPWEDTTLIGTTQTGFDGNPADVQVKQQDIDYLIDAAGYLIPDAGLKASDVIYSFAGVRPTLSAGKHGTEDRASRRHRVAVEPEGVITLAGGTFTTFRQMAEEATDALIETVGDRRKPSETKSRPYFPTLDPRTDRRADLGLWAALVSRYGARAGSVFDVCLSNPDLTRPVIEGQSLRMGELVYALVFEKATNLDDLIYRRTRLAWRREMNDALRARLATALARYISP